ncbi:MAG: two-component sensor histidine kinase, partial [Burkholderiaceae bacterium]
MRRSITARMVLMFALCVLVLFAVIGGVLYGVLGRELVRHQNDELNTNLQNMRYSIDRFGDLEHWARLQAKMDTLGPGDGSVRFWVLSDDPRFQYGKGMAEIDALTRETGRSLLLPGEEKPYRTLSAHIPPFEQRPAVRLIVGKNTEPYARTRRTFLTALVS